jgi:hypothetical protein
VNSTAAELSRVRRILLPEVLRRRRFADSHERHLHGRSDTPWIVQDGGRSATQNPMHAAEDEADRLRQRLPSASVEGGWRRSAQH